MVHIIPLLEPEGWGLMGYGIFCSLVRTIITIGSFIYFDAIFVNQVVMEENKEADSTTGQATHRVSRGIHDKVCAYM